MNKKFFYLFWLILLFSLTIKIIPALNNNFYFTMDQGRDAVYAREIINRHQMILEGPETGGIKGFFAGPLWYYFISIGYFIFRGHPFGAVFILILFNTAVTGVLMLWLAKRISPFIALMAGFSLQFFWPFYDSSRYAFNPFLLVPLAIFLIIFLTDSMGGKEPASRQARNYFILAAIPVGLAFHSEVASVVVFFLLYSLTGVYLTVRRKISLKILLFSIIILSVFFLPCLVSEINNNFSQTMAIFQARNSKVLSGTNFSFIAQKFLELINQSILPQNILLSLIFLAATILFLIRFYNKSRPSSHSSLITYNFSLLTLIFWIISWVWFGGNKGWQSWHTVYLPPLLFVSVILVLYTLPKKIGGFLFLVIFVSQIFYFKSQYLFYLRPSGDPSLLRNELLAIDWVYRRSNGKGFYVYNYLPSVLDYPYQYLFWWHGRKKYGYLPCEFGSYLGSPKLFIPGSKHYEEPKRDCTNLRFLIIEPDKNLIVQNEWQQRLRVNTQLIEQIKVGQITVEMRETILPR